MSYPFLRFFLFFFPAEFAHHLSLKSLSLFEKFCLIPFRLKSLECDAFTYKGLKFKNRIGLSAGLDKNGDHIKPLSKLGFGFIELGTVTPRPQEGNPKPRLFRIKKSKGIINRLGFNNKGVDYLVENVKKIKDRKYVLGLNIGKNKDTPENQAVDDYLICFEKCYAYADYVTINISSPNTPNLRDFQSKEKLHPLLSALKSAQKKLSQKYQKNTLLFIKISPDISLENIKDIMEACLEHQIDGLILTNTSIQKDLVTEKQKNLDQQGGISGAPLFSLSTQILGEFHALLKKPWEFLLIGAGGIDSAEKALCKIENGANLIQLYSGLIYEGPSLLKNILHGIRNYFKK